MLDSQYLNEFLDGIPNERLKKQWSDAAQGSGRRFVVRFQQEMDENEVSFTSENTVQAKMQAILAGGLGEATMECLNNLINDYELWHNALAVKIPDAQRAFAYKKLVVGLSERISNQMEHKINYIETRGWYGNFESGDFRKKRPNSTHHPKIHLLYAPNEPKMSL